MPVLELPRRRSGGPKRQRRRLRVQRPLSARLSRRQLQRLPSCSRMPTSLLQHPHHSPSRLGRSEVAARAGTLTSLQQMQRLRPVLQPQSRKKPALASSVQLPARGLVPQHTVHRQQRWQLSLRHLLPTLLPLASGGAQGPWRSLPLPPLRPLLTGRQQMASRPRALHWL